MDDDTTYAVQRQHLKLSMLAYAQSRRRRLRLFQYGIPLTLMGALISAVSIDRGTPAAPEIASAPVVQSESHRPTAAWLAATRLPAKVNEAIARISTPSDLSRTAAMAIAEGRTILEVRHLSDEALSLALAETGYPADVHADHIRWRDHTPTSWSGPLSASDGRSRTSVIDQAPTP
jgi:hypothetical protein